MKPITKILAAATLLLSLIFLQPLQAQISQPYALWEDSLGVYNIGRVNPANGQLTSMNTISGMGGIVVPNTTVFNPATGEYIALTLFNPQTFITRFSASTGFILGSIPNTDNYVGLKYNCRDDSIYCLFENNNNYQFGTLDPVNGAFSSLGNLSGVSAHVGSTFTLNPDSGWYSFFGFSGGNLSMIQIDIATGNVLNTNAISDNVVGQFYNCNDGQIWGLWEDQQNFEYWLVTMDPATGTKTDVHLLTGVTPGFITESATYNPRADQFTYRGFSGNNPTIFAIDVSTGTVTASATLGGNAAGIEDSLCCACAAPVAAFSDSVSQDSVFLTDQSTGGVLNWFWTFGDGNSSTQQNPHHGYAASGSYEICLVVDNGCTTDSTCDSVSVTLVYLDAAEDGFDVYPNPVKEQLHLRLGAGLEGPFEVTLHSPDGRQVFRRKTEAASLRIRTGGLPAGMYMLSLRHAGGQTTHRILIE